MAYKVFFGNSGTTTVSNIINLNIGDSWKTVTAIWVNIGDSWKAVTAVWLNIGDSWKQIW
jgi:hypothetical protein